MSRVFGEEGGRKITASPVVGLVFLPSFLRGRRI